MICLLKIFKFNYIENFPKITSCLVIKKNIILSNTAILNFLICDAIKYALNSQEKCTLLLS